MYVGTAGYSYPHWRSSGAAGTRKNNNNMVFYPKNVTHKNELRYYSGVFPTVEINASFHGVPRLETLASWSKEQSKGGFVFAFKVPQVITHEKRLQGIDDPLLFFLHRLYDGFSKKEEYKEDKEVLLDAGDDDDDEKEGNDASGRCGDGDGEATTPPTTTTTVTVIVLFQLPPSLSRDIAKLDTIGKILRCFEEDHRNHAYRQVVRFQYVFEFRNKTWYTQEVYDTLKKYNFGLCENISPDNSTNHISMATAASKFHYIRCHKLLGDAEGALETNYSNEMIAKIADSIVEKRREGITVYCYFLNDHGGYGPNNAKTLMKYIQEKSEALLPLEQSKSRSESASMAAAAASSSSVTLQREGNQDPRRLVHNWKPDPAATSISSMFAKQLKDQGPSAKHSTSSPGKGQGSIGRIIIINNNNHTKPSSSSSKSNTTAGTKRDIRTAFVKHGTSPPHTKKSTTTTRTTTSSSSAKKQKKENSGTTRTKPGAVGTLHSFFSPKKDDQTKTNT